MRGALLSLLLLAACDRPGGGVQLGTETSQSEPRVVNLGATFDLRMPANESTGYHWALAVPLDSMKVADRGHWYLPSDPSGSRAGAGGMEVWRFEAVDTGSTEIVVHYRRAREAPAEQRRYQIQIR